MSINMLNKESVLFRSISSVSLLLSLYEISQYVLHAAIIWLTKKSHVWLRSVRSFTLSVFLWQNNTTSCFSVPLKFGALYITGQWGRFRIKRLIYVFIYFFGILLLFFIIKFVFLLFSFLFFDEVSKFYDKILTNQKRILVMKNCQ